MITQPMTFTLRDGRGARLRAPEPSDAAALLDHLRITAGETDFLSRTPDECSLTLEDEVRYIHALRESTSGYDILCEVDGHVAGTCRISFLGGFRRGHRANVGIALQQAYWGLGIGTAMFTELIALARRHGAEQVELSFTEGNHRARALYEKFGFRITGMTPRAIRLSDGSLVSEYHMMLLLEEDD